jgi:hypothetical protein
MCVRGIGAREAVVTSPQDPKQYVHRNAVDPEGSRVGKIVQVYFDDQTEQPLWVLVESGLVSKQLSFAPAHGSRLDGEIVVLAVSKEQIKNAPSIGRDAQLGPSEQDALRQHYSDYFSTAENTGAYEQSGQATQWESDQATRPGSAES